MKDEVKQLLILLIVIFCVLSAYILRLSNHICFRLLRSRLLFLIRRHILVVDLFHKHNGIRTCFIQFKNQQGVTFKNNTR